MKKVKKDFWEEIIPYPSFNIRFGLTLFVALLFFCTLAYFAIFKLEIVVGVSEKINALNLAVQSATLVLGIFAAYYALRQLVETRFTSLDEAGSREIERKHYSRAFDKWKEAFYIRPEASVFTNFCETLLLIGDYEAFDHYMKFPELPGLFKKDIFQENSDQIILLYLKSIRHLLVKNQGEAEKYLSELIALVKKDGLPGLQWNFLDLRTSRSYQDLNGECKDMAENLISYLSKNIPEVRKEDFEAGNFASQLVDEASALTNSEGVVL